MSLFVSNTVKHRRMRGDAPVTCMLIIVGIIVICIACYYLFWYNRALERSITGEDIVVKDNIDETSLQNYRRRVQSYLAPHTVAMVKETRRLCGPVLNDKVSNINDTDKDLEALITKFHDFIEDINEQTCPKKHQQMQKDLAMAIGHSWRAACKCRSSLGEKDENKRKALIKEANEDLKQAVQYSKSGERLSVKI